MNQDHRANLDTKFQLVAWLNIANPDLSIDDAIAKCEALGNTVIEVDTERRRIKAIDTELFLEETVWQCDKCGAYSTSEQTIKQHEAQCNGSKSS